MDTLLIAAIFFSAGSFIPYGISLLVSEKMKEEFIRYKFEQFRILTAVLEILGALGLLAGIYVPFLLVFSAAGLTLLMFFAFIIRIRLKDAYHLILPSLCYLLLNMYIFIEALSLYTNL